MVLYFLRHGQAGHHYATDFERELTDEGKHASKNVGKFCAAMNIHFTHALVSPLIRAQQTAHGVLKKVADVPLTETEHLTPESDPRNLLELLRTFPNDSRVLLVTHEPFVSTCISTLISGSEVAHIVMKTTSFACVETHGIPVKGSGKLRWLLTPDMLENLI
ncbi:MAG: phosphohistidine phosphatase SixA [Bacteriovoracaceae bacterium]